MSRPLYRVTFSRKDGADIEFTNYRGEIVEKKYAPLGALFPRENGEGFSLAVDPASVGHKLDPETYFYNVYPVDRDDAPRGARQQQSRRPAQARKTSKDDGDLSF